MEDLKDKFKQAPTAMEFVKVVWETSEKNGAAYNYTAGIIDALRYAGAVTLEEYDELYNLYL